MHPNIVQVYDYGESQEVAFIAMELVAGKTLHQRLLERRRCDFKQIASLVEQLLSALEYAHQNGVIHQDIKPANILLTSDGRLKVTDFGIAQVESTRMVVNNETIGTPHFMAPELISGSVATPSSDVYSAGTVAYELLTGQRAFSGTTAFVMRQVMDPEVKVAPPSQVDPRIAPELDEAVLKALAKRPEERFQNAAEFRLAFQRGIEATLRVVGDAPEPLPMIDITIIQSSDLFLKNVHIPMGAGEVKVSHILPNMGCFLVDGERNPVDLPLKTTIPASQKLKGLVFSAITDVIADVEDHNVRLRAAHKADVESIRRIGNNTVTDDTHVLEAALEAVGVHDHFSLPTSEESLNQRRDMNRRSSWRAGENSVFGIRSDDDPLCSQLSYENVLSNAGKDCKRSCSNLQHPRYTLIQRP
jgi:serine/threonine protein kinase